MRPFARLLVLALLVFGSDVAIACDDPLTSNRPAMAVTSTSSLSLKQRIDLITALWSAVRWSHATIEPESPQWNLIREEANKRVTEATTDEEVYWIAKQMVARLNDGHSYFLAPTDFALVNGRYQLRQLGLYAVLKGDSTHVAQVRKRSPAEQAGLKRGDQIVRVNSFVCNVHKALELLEHTSIEIEVVRGEKQFSVSLEPVPQSLESLPVFSLLRTEPRTAYLKLHNLSDEGVAAALEKALDELVSEAPLVGLVVDLRGAPGGNSKNLSSALSHFVEGPMGQTTGRFPKQVALNVEPSKLYPSLQSTRLVVLVDEGTNSAAEIFAYLLQAKRQALVIGMPTAGNMQGVISLQLERGAAMLLRIEAAVFLPSGVSVKPDIEMDVPWLDYPISADPMIRRALGALDNAGAHNTPRLRLTESSSRE